ncbi:MAG: sulfatase-like hydrolase/transferase [Pirellulaceae bacterium]|nr:sulfatase-like hydrolase/transferase [Pirellulaceae bacterium]MDP6554079.1 sulfatase-like hydrolase/transferase [Pirellulaceae bacterium]
MRSSRVLSVVVKRTTFGTWALLMLLVVLLPSSVMANDRRPNIVVVLADDLGYGDLACYGHPVIKTPNLDQLAREGLRFTDCYAAAANCSPARTGLMTGRTPYRVGIHNWIPMFSPMHVRRSEITIATLLRSAGYSTCHVGKWHLNGDFNLPSQPQPSDHGFDHWFSTQNNALPNHKNPVNFVRNGRPAGPLKGYAAPLVADEAITWLENGRDEEKPFFLYVCFHEPHEPIASDKRFSDLYPPPGKPTRNDLSRAAHHGNVTQMDDAFGRLAATLDRLKLSDNTFLLFTSDNGPAITGIHPHGSAGPLRAKKGHLYDGGIRVPGILRWPGHTAAGETSNTPICGVDLLPTLCGVAGIPVPSDRKIDGANILPLLEGKRLERTTPLYWHFLRAASKTKVAMRIGDWKLLAHLNIPALKPSADLLPEEMQAIKTAELAKFELYNLKTDIGETTDLSASQPDRLARMSTLMKSLYHEVQAESPVWEAWTWPRYESQRIEWPAYRNRK